MLSREILFSKLGAAGADSAGGLRDFVIGHYKPPKDWRTERPASTSVLLGPPREMMVAGNDSDQYFGWRVPTPLVQGLTGMLSASSKFSPPRPVRRRGTCHGQG